MNAYGTHDRTHKFEKSKLLEILRENRAKHRKIFEEAIDGYRKTVIQTLERSLTAAKAGKNPILNFGLTRPVDQTKDYDRVIRMYELSQDATIDLTEHEFAQYVMDDWTWKQNFLHSNSFYSGTAAAEIAATQSYEEAIGQTA